MNNTFFIVNPYSNKKKSLSIWLKWKRKLPFKPNFKLTKYKGHAIEIARKAIKQGYRIIVAFGGDGTANEVANGIIGSNACLGVFPAGSGNDFAKFFTYNPNNIKYKKIDVGKINNRFFINNLGIGFDANVSTYMQTSPIKGEAGYFIGVLRTLLQYSPSLVELTIDGEKISGEFMTISVGNGKYHGGIFKMTPKAEFDDGILDLSLVRKTGKFYFLSKITKAFTGEHLSMPETKYFQFRTLIIKAKKVLKAHVDGEINVIQNKVFNITIHKKALNVCYS